MAKKKKARKLQPTQSATREGEQLPRSNSPKRKKKSKMNIKQIFIFGAIGLAMLAFIFGPYIKNIGPGLNNNTEEVITNDGRPDPNIPEPQFRKDSELSFLAANKTDTLQQIDIEIVKDEEAVRQGLMYRKSMEENQGMLFIMPGMGPQSFWMKNTYIPLDILFINHNRQIVTIHKNTTPFSETGLPSTQNAQFIVEVNAGYCDKNGIKVGDFVKF